MIHLRLKGGMGNQLFQYALGRQLAKQLNTEASMDLVKLLNRSMGEGFVYRDYDLDIFHIEHRFSQPAGVLRAAYKLKNGKVNRLIQKLGDRGKKYVREAHFHFQPEILTEATDNTIYEGWFQSPKYFAGVEKELREDLRFVHPIIPASGDLFQRIKNTNSVCLNVRRTDFLKVDTLNATNLDYFLRAAQYVAGEVSNPHFFIFSDDVEWCRENILLDHPTEVVDHAHKGFKFGNYLQLMSRCKHYIIPNSSFAWWAVWLNPRKEKVVVAPKMWFTDPSIDTTDLVPADWVRM